MCTATWRVFAKVEFDPGCPMNPPRRAALPARRGAENRETAICPTPSISHAAGRRRQRSQGCKLGLKPDGPRCDEKPADLSTWKRAGTSKVRSSHTPKGERDRCNWYINRPASPSSATRSKGGDWADRGKIIRRHLRRRCPARRRRVRRADATEVECGGRPAARTSPECRRGSLRDSRRCEAQPVSARRPHGKLAMLADAASDESCHRPRGTARPLRHSVSVHCRRVRYGIRIRI